MGGGAQVSKTPGEDFGVVWLLTDSRLDVLCNHSTPQDSLVMNIFHEHFMMQHSIPVVERNNLKWTFY